MTETERANWLRTLRTLSLAGDAALRIRPDMADRQELLDIAQEAGVVLDWQGTENGAEWRILVRAGD
ncbi:MAG: hypothetical protein HOV96_19405 [Nonomuraea sp.]|nr:hypothetical protein [Nonomuraea sp.]NUR59334.1 hypothetical protein [Catenulispora sp.]